MPKKKHKKRKRPMKLPSKRQCRRICEILNVTDPCAAERLALQLQCDIVAFEDEVKDELEFELEECENQP